MIYVVLSLHTLGIIGAVAAVGRDDTPLGVREIVICMFWPLSVAAAIGLDFVKQLRRMAPR